MVVFSVVLHPGSYYFGSSLNLMFALVTGLAVNLVGSQIEFP